MVTMAMVAIGLDFCALSALAFAKISLPEHPKIRLPSAALILMPLLPKTC